MPELPPQLARCAAALSSCRARALVSDLRAAPARSRCSAVDAPLVRAVAQDPVDARPRSRPRRHRREAGGLGEEAVPVAAEARQLLRRHERAPRAGQEARPVAAAEEGDHGHVEGARRSASGPCRRPGRGGSRRSGRAAAADRRRRRRGAPPARRAPRHGGRPRPSARPRRRGRSAGPAARDARAGGRPAPRRARPASPCARCWRCRQGSRARTARARAPGCAGAPRARARAASSMQEPRLGRRERVSDERRGQRAVLLDLVVAPRRRRPPPRVSRRGREVQVGRELVQRREHRRRGARGRRPRAAVTRARRSSHSSTWVRE